VDEKTSDLSGSDFAMLEESAVTNSLRVLTVNVHKGFSFLNRRFVLPELRDAVREVAADVVFLQEVHGSRQRHASAGAHWPEGPQYEYLADQIWQDFAYGRNAVYADGDHGNAVLSKFPIVRYENIDVSAAGQEKRGLLHCVIHLPGRADMMHAICVHLGLKQAHRAQQLDQLCERVRCGVPPTEPLLVAGDFNDWQKDAHAVLERGAGLREVFVDAHGRAARTYPARFPMLQLDRIYVRSTRHHAPLALPARPWDRLSDHTPIAAEIQL
jgi:endonuclease/exonuclease/phosphatase family metal-dependent hydrolase